ncbi:MAG: methionyl-tRNA formyltransferase [Candidatus Paceibacterota bacterium]|jgi:methionyl-tRNA formyltransferase
MRYVFWGSFEFAQGVFEQLVEARLFPLALVCNPDRPVGRHEVLTPPLTKTFALKHGIPVLQPESINDDMLHDALARLKPDVFVVTAYAKIIPDDVINLPHYGTLGVHPSHLPRYRGATPIQTALMAGEEHFGISIYRMDEKIDHGPILAQTDVVIPESERTYNHCIDVLSTQGGALLAQTLPPYCAGELVPHPQDETQATYTKKFSTEDGQVDFTQDDPIEILRKIQALTPSPGVFAFVDGKRTKLLAAHREADNMIITRITKEGKAPSDTRILLALKSQG